MKRILTLATVFVFLSLSIYTTSFRSPDLSPIKIVQQQYYDGLNNTERAIGEILNKSISLNNTNASESELREAFIKARINFKSIEFLAEKLDAAYIKDYINGAPLPRLEKKVPMPTRIEPNGLQVLDEIIFDESPINRKSEIIALSTALKTDFERFKKGQVNVNFYDRSVFEACREELIRIFTLGLTGFDTPLSGNAIAEANTALISIKNALQVYKSFFNKVEAKLGDQIINDLEGAISYIKLNNDFDSFDRLEFYRAYLRPLDKKIQYAHLKSGIETASETSQHISSVNYASSDFFSTDFLNPYYFTRLTEEDDSEKLAELGKILFYDPILSFNNDRSCASCHNPQKAFTDGKRKSIAKDFNGNVDRNSPTLINSVYSERYFHDMRATNLETLLEHVVTNRKEFGLSLVQLENKLNGSIEYQKLFDEAFQNSNLKGIHSQSITAALTSYIKSLNAFNSEFDVYVRGESETIDQSIRNGFNLFMGKAACGTCHFAPVFNGTIPPQYRESESEILGTPLENSPEHFEIDTDEGRYRGIAKEKIDFYRFSFKTPTVRNIALTAPYMHNGVYTTLEEVVDFYNKGGGEGLGYEVPNQTLPFDKLDLTEQEQYEIIAFMKALTDTVGLTSIPKVLPKFENNTNLNSRKVGGNY